MDLYGSTCLCLYPGTRIYPGRAENQNLQCQLKLYRSAAGGAREWKLFDQQSLDIEVILMRSSAAAAALASGDLDYQSGIGTASVSATLSGLDARALWASTSRIVYWLMASPQFKSVRDLRQKKIGVTGLGGTSHVALTAALEKSGVGAKDYVAVSVPSRNWCRLWSRSLSMRHHLIRPLCFLPNAAVSPSSWTSAL